MLASNADVKNMWLYTFIPSSVSEDIQCQLYLVYLMYIIAMKGVRS